MMLNPNRRNFLWGNWRALSPSAAGETPPAEAVDREKACPALPPEFSPAMLRFEGQHLGLPVETLDEETLVQAVSRAMSLQTPCPVKTELPPP